MAALIRSLTYATAFVGFVLVFLPARALELAGVARPVASVGIRIAGGAITSIGVTLMVSCVLTFALVGRGTPAPFDPPRRLVVSGPYRFVRNPMYIGADLALAGAAVYYQAITLWAYLLLFATVTHAFVVLYEEPTLRRLFGDDYLLYSSRVNRWIPRFGKVEVASTRKRRRTPDHDRAEGDEASDRQEEHG